jgi:hypothetical protein
VEHVESIYHFCFHGEDESGISASVEKNVVHYPKRREIEDESLKIFS